MVYNLYFHKTEEHFTKAPQLVCEFDFAPNAVRWDEVERAIIITQNVMDGVSSIISMDDFNFFLESADSAEVFIRKELNNWKLNQMRMVNVTEIKSKILDIMNWKGQAYQPDDEIDIAVKSIMDICGMK